MGSVTSLVCSATFCLERVLTWACCAFLLMLLMFLIVLLIIYGISVGYHYAQKELASFAFWSRVSTTPRYVARSGDESPLLRQLAENSSELEEPEPEQETTVNLITETEKAETINTNVPRILAETTEEMSTTNVSAETENTPVLEPELTPNERQIARRLLRRFRRSRNNTSTAALSFIRSLRVNSTVLPLM